MMIIAMRIAAVDVDLVLLPAIAPPFDWRRGLRGSAPARTTAVLRITTEDGSVGEAYHEWSGPMLADIVDRVLRDELVGERADRREWLWHRLWELDRTEEFPIWLKKIQAELGVTTIYVTHDQVEAMTMGHRVAVMRKGECGRSRLRRSWTTARSISSSAASSEARR